MTAVTFVSDKQFKTAIKENPNTPIVGVHKGFPCQVKIVDEKRRLIDFIISTESVDRMWDKIYIKGWELENYLQNPVVLFGHDHYSPPIAKTVSLSKHPTKKTLEARAEFAPKEVHPFADMIFNLYLQGFMKATSVGFRPLEYKLCDDDDERKCHYGIDFIRQELLEYSAVSVPANPEALIDAKSKGIDLTPLKSWTSEVLDAYDEHTKNGLIIPKKTLEQMYKHSGSFGKRLSLNTNRINELAKANLAKIKEQAEMLEGSGMRETEEGIIDVVASAAPVVEMPVEANEPTESKTPDLAETVEVVDALVEVPKDVDLSDLDELTELEVFEDNSKAPEILDVLPVSDLTDEIQGCALTTASTEEDEGDDGEELTLEEALIYMKTDTSLENLIEVILEINKNAEVVADSRYIRAVNYLQGLAVELLAETEKVLHKDQKIATEKQVDKNPTLCQDDQEFDFDNFVTELEKEEVNNYSNLDDFDIDEDTLKEVLQDVIKNVVDVEVKRELKKLSGKLD